MTVHEGEREGQKVVKNCPRGIWMAPYEKMRVKFKVLFTCKQYCIVLLGK